MFPSNLIADAERLIDELRDRGQRLAVAESCTGGLIAGALTEVAGASDVFDRGFVTYSNGAKVDMLGIDIALIAGHGAVSEEVSRAMAAGALAKSGANVALAVTGIAGPGGGTTQKPVGLIHISAVRSDGSIRHEEHRYGDRSRREIRLATVRDAIALARAIL